MTNHNRVEEALFLTVCSLLEELESIMLTKSPLPKRRLAVRTISRWFNKFTGGEVYQVFRLLTPEMDLNRVYYLKEKTLSKKLCEILGLSLTSRADKLLAWRNDSELDKIQGDLSSILYNLIKASVHSLQPTLNIMQVNEYLDGIVGAKRISAGFTFFDDILGKPFLTSLYINATALEVKWLTRIILKDLQLKVDTKVFFDGFHGMMWNIFSAKHNLKIACDETVRLIYNGQTSGVAGSPEQYQMLRREFMGFQLGKYISIMACGRGTSIKQVIERLAPNTVCVEQKFDGERLQAHFNKAWPGRIRIFSKGGRDSTADRYRCHEQLLRALKFTDPSNGIENCVVEGELLVFNEETQGIEPFGTVQHLQAHKFNQRGDFVSGARHHLVVLFDVLYVNGEDLSSRPLEYRRRMLESLVITLPKYVELSKIQLLDLSKPEAPHELGFMFAQALNSKMEGLIVKKTGSSYIPNNRSEWMKLKSDYIEGFGDTAEFAVVGVAYGVGNRGLLDILLIGCLVNKDECMEGNPPVFSICFLVVNGLTVDEKELFSNYLKNKDLLLPPDQRSEAIFTAKFAVGFHNDVDFYLRRPIVVELLGSGFVKEQRQPHFTLRFPRIKRLLLDQSFLETVSFQEMQEMAQVAHTLGDHISLLEEMKQIQDHLVTYERPSPRESRLQLHTAEYIFYVSSSIPGKKIIADKLEALGIDVLFSHMALAYAEGKIGVLLVNEQSQEHLSLGNRPSRIPLYLVQVERLQAFLEDPQSVVNSLTPFINKG